MQEGARRIVPHYLAVQGVLSTSVYRLLERRDPRAGAIQRDTIPATIEAPPIMSDRCMPCEDEIENTTMSSDDTSHTKIAQPMRMRSAPSDRRIRRN
jgi:hypothetical protein